MKINLDDPNLTAFALGELTDAERAAMEQIVASSPEAQEFVAETQQLARLLKADYAADAQLPPERLPNVIRMREQRRLWSSTQWGSLAAALTIFAVIAVFAVTMIRRDGGTLAIHRPSAVNLPPKAPVPEATIEAEVPPIEQTYAYQQPPATVPEQMTEAPAAPPPVMADKATRK